MNDIFLSILLHERDELTAHTIKIFRPSFHSLILNVVFFLHVYLFFNGYERLVSSITEICLYKSNPKFAPNIKKRRNLGLALFCYKVIS